MLLRSTPVRAALTIVALIAVGSATYYLIESTPPKLAFATATTGTVTEQVSGTGIVSPIQNPTLTFTQGGRITILRAAVGQKVYAGQLLASTDTGVLAAQLASAQANLNKVLAGPRGVDVAGKNTAVAQAAQTASANLLSLQNLIVSAHAQGEEAVYTHADSLFSGVGTQAATGANPQLTVLMGTLTPQSNAISKKAAAEMERGMLTTEFAQWDAEVAMVNTTLSQQQTVVQAQASIAHLQHVRQLLDDLIYVLENATPNQNFPQASLVSAIANANSGRDSVNTLIAQLSTGIQSVQGQVLSVQSAQDALNQSLAGATPQDIDAARAQVAAVAAQIRQLEIVAPFSGTIAAVNVKQGDVIAPNTQAISLIPNGTSEVDIYLSEIEVAQLSVGEKAEVTLDAYGAGRVFPATVATIDRAPSTPPGQSANAGAGSAAAGYKVTLAFTEPDPSIALGMHANATIHGAAKSNVVLVPRTALLQNGTQSYVLVASGTGNTTVKTPVQIGLVGTDSVEIVHGITSGTRVATVGGA